MKKSVTSIEDVKRTLENYCIYQERCYKEVENKLFEYHLIPEAKDEIILHLLQNDFLNEERFAVAFASGKVRIKKWGKKKVAYQLKYKGVSEKNIDIALKKIDKEDYFQIIHEVAVKKALTIQNKNIFQKKGMLIKHLQTKGFEIELIMETINSIDIKNIFEK